MRRDWSRGVTGDCAIRSGGSVYSKSERFRSFSMSVGIVFDLFFRNTRFNQPDIRIIDIDNLLIGFAGKRPAPSAPLAQTDTVSPSMSFEVKHLPAFFDRG